MGGGKGGGAVYTKATRTRIQKAHRTFFKTGPRRDKVSFNSDFILQLRKQIKSKNPCVIFNILI